MLAGIGEPHITNTAQPLTEEDWKDRDLKNQMIHVDKVVRQTIGDDIKELSDKEQNHCQSLAGVLRWTVELGRLDILHPVSLMSGCLAQARIGHLNQVLRMFVCLTEVSREIKDADGLHAPTYHGH